MQVRGVLNRPGRPGGVRRHAGHPQARHAVGRAAQRHAKVSIGDVDVVCLVVDATAAVGRGDRYVADRVPRDSIVVVNKIDLPSPEQVLEQLRGGRRARPRRSTSRCRPSPATGVDALVDAIVARLPEGPQLLPRRHGDRRARGVLGGRARARAAAGRRPRRAAALDRDAGSPNGSGPASAARSSSSATSQKGIVIGQGGAVLKQVGIAVREQLPRAPSSSFSSASTRSGSTNRRPYAGSATEVGRVGLLVVVGLLALASCGSDRHDTSPASTTPNTTLVVSGTDPAATTTITTIGAVTTTAAPATTVRVTAAPTTAVSAPTTTASPYLAYRGAGWIEAENAVGHRHVEDSAEGPFRAGQHRRLRQHHIGTDRRHRRPPRREPRLDHVHRRGVPDGFLRRPSRAPGLASSPTDTSPPTDPVVDPVTHMAEAHWPVSLRVPITSEWPPGTYLLKLVSAIGAESYVPLTIRDDGSTADLVAIDAVTTWQAYNDWGACSLYECLMDEDTPRSTVVSFDRPIFGFFGHGAADYLDHELPLISLAEERGLDITYITDIDPRPTAGTDAPTSGGAVAGT